MKIEILETAQRDLVEALSFWPARSWFGLVFPGQSLRRHWIIKRLLASLINTISGLL